MTPRPWMGLLRVAGGPCSQRLLDAPYHGTPPPAALAFPDGLWGSQDPTPGLPGGLTLQEPIRWGRDKVALW